MVYEGPAFDFADIPFLGTMLPSTASRFDPESACCGTLSSSNSIEWSSRFLTRDTRFFAGTETSTSGKIFVEGLLSAESWDNSPLRLIPFFAAVESLKCVEVEVPFHRRFDGGSPTSRVSVLRFRFSLVSCASPFSPVRPYFPFPLMSGVDSNVPIAPSLDDHQLQATSSSF